MSIEQAVNSDPPTRCAHWDNQGVGRLYRHFADHRLGGLPSPDRPRRTTSGHIRDGVTPAVIEIGNLVHAHEINHTVPQPGGRI
jgi:hypothetical protein